MTSQRNSSVLRQKGHSNYCNWSGLRDVLENFKIFFIIFFFSFWIVMLPIHIWWVFELSKKDSCLVVIWYVRGMSWFQQWKEITIVMRRVLIDRDDIDFNVNIMGEVNWCCKFSPALYFWRIGKPWNMLFVKFQIQRYNVQTWAAYFWNYVNSVLADIWRSKIAILTILEALNLDL